MRATHRLPIARRSGRAPIPLPPRPMVRRARIIQLEVRRECIAERRGGVPDRRREPPPSGRAEEASEPQPVGLRAWHRPANRAPLTAEAVLAGRSVLPKIE